jgi:hypothetical protein
MTETAQIVHRSAKGRIVLTKTIESIRKATGFTTLVGTGDVDVALYIAGETEGDFALFSEKQIKRAFRSLGLRASTRFSSFYVDDVAVVAADARFAGKSNEWLIEYAAWLAFNADGERNEGQPKSARRHQREALAILKFVGRRMQGEVK